MFRQGCRCVAVIALTLVGACGRGPSSISVTPTTGCGASTPDPLTYVSLPGRPFYALATTDGCWIFVSMHAAADGTGSGVAVLRRAGGRVALVRTVLGPGKDSRGASVNVAGMSLTHDGKLLVVAAADRLSFYDVAQLASGAENPLLGTIRPGGDLPGYFHVNLTRDDRFLFASEHDQTSIAVINLAEARRSGFMAASIVGKIPAGWGTIGLVFSPDQRHLYATTQVAHESWHWQDTCKPLTATSPNAAPNHPYGAILAIDVARAITDAAHSVVGVVAAGCDPVRLAISPTGDRVYATARSDNALLAFDVSKLRTDSARALIGSVPLGTGPVGVTVIDGGRRVVVANATRFANTTTGTEGMTVIDATLVGSGRNAVVGTVGAAAGPLELRLTTDGRTLLLTNYSAQKLELVDLMRLPLNARSP